VVDRTKNRTEKKTCENRGILKPSWAFVETNKANSETCWSWSLGFAELGKNNIVVQPGKLNFGV
jgi:hypothetical protein